LLFLLFSPRTNFKDEDIKAWGKKRKMGTATPVWFGPVGLAEIPDRLLVSRAGATGNFYGSFDKGASWRMFGSTNFLAACPSGRLS
jgi:hypothetical protein